MNSAIFEYAYRNPDSEIAQELFSIEDIDSDSFEEFGVNRARRRMKANPTPENVSKFLNKLGDNRARMANRDPKIKGPNPEFAREPVYMRAFKRKVDAHKKYGEAKQDIFKGMTKTEKRQALAGTAKHELGHN